MKKSIIVGMLAISLFGLTACGNNKAKQSSSNTEIQNKVVNNKKEGLSIHTNYGKLTLDESFAGPINDPSKTYKGGISFSYVVKNTSNKPRSAEQIANGVVIDLVKENKSTENILNHTDGVEEIFKSNDIDGYNQMIEASHKWTNTKIKPNNSINVVDPYIYTLKNKKDANIKYLKISGPATKTTTIKINEVNGKGKTYYDPYEYVDSLGK